MSLPSTENKNAELMTSTNIANCLPYQNFAQAKRAIADVAPIDFFLAKEVLVSLLPDSQGTEGSAELSKELGKEQSENACAEIPNLDGDEINNLFHLLMYVSAVLRAGHTCAYLSDVANITWGESAEPSIIGKEVGLGSELANKNSVETQQGFSFASAEFLTALLAKFKIAPEDNQLLVIFNERLYLRRYFQFEQDLALEITSKLSSTKQTQDNSTEQALNPTDAQAPNPAQVKHCLTTIFASAYEKNSDGSANHEVDWQLVAVANALTKNFSVIAGGPGTGKTYTVTKLLAALVMLAEQSGRKLPNILLSAPTGKAAQRLSESICAAVSQFEGEIDQHLLAAIPNKASTLHRLLGVIPNSPNFRHHQNNKLDIDILLIDEVSMVDLPMFTRVMRALPAHAKVILLGDADQLPSVAAGSVLADLAQRPHQGYSQENLNYLLNVTENSALTNFAASSDNQAQDHVTFLTKSRRFDGTGLIGRLASAVIKSEQEQSWHLIHTPCNNDKVLNNQQPLLLDANDFSWIKTFVKQYYLPIFSCQKIEDAFNQLAKFRLLCATRQGISGVESLNQMVIEQLKQTGAVANKVNTASPLFHGLPIMIGENDYRLGLFNGDIGLIWQHPLGHLMAVFEDESGEYRWVMPSRLPSYEAVYAMTIHKTQGSEFNHVAMVLPTQKDNKLLSRELLYTGITRAKSYISVASNQTVWKNAVATKVVRRSGLSI